MGTNAPPTATNGAVTVDEDKTFYFWFRPALLGYSDPDGNSMDSFTITEMPARGALTMSGLADQQRAVQDTQQKCRKPGTLPAVQAGPGRERNALRNLQVQGQRRHGGQHR